MRQESVNQIWEVGQNSDPFAQVIMGLWYYEGHIIQRNVEKGIYILRQLAPHILWANDILTFIDSNP